MGKAIRPFCWHTKSLWSLILCTFFNDFIIASEQEQTTPWGQNFDVKRKALSVCPYFVSLKTSLWFIHIFNDFIHVYSPRAWADKPLVTKFDVIRKALSLCPIVAGFNKISLESDLLHIFYDLIHVYSHRAGADNSLETKGLMSTERPYRFAYFCKLSSISIHTIFLSNACLTNECIYPDINDQTFSWINGLCEGIASQIPWIPSI